MIKLFAKKEFFFQRLSMTHLPVSPVIILKTLHYLEIHSGLQCTVIGHNKFILLGVGDLQDTL
jgi:hypothetical protein